MPPIYIDGKEVVKRYIGIQEVVAAYVGSQQVFSSFDPATGVFFDSAAGDSFVGNFVASSTTGVVISPSRITLDSDTPVDIGVMFQLDGVDLSQCFDSFTIEAQYNITGPFGGAGTPGFLVGYRNDVFAWSGLQDQGHGGTGGGTVLPVTVLGNSPIGAGASGRTIGSGIACSAKITFDNSTINFKGTYGGSVLMDSTAQLLLTASTYELPRMFSKFGMRFQGGHIEVTGFKVSVNYPNAKYALIGDSLTQGRFAGSYSAGWGALFRASHPNDTIIAGAPSAKIEDWTAERLAVVARLKPKYAVLLLGTNNAAYSESAAVMKAKYDALVARVIATGMLPIVVAPPPKSWYELPNLKSHLQATHPRFIDCYTPLWSGSGFGLAAAYDSGDGTHPNSAGHALIASTINAAIVANGWT